MPFVRLIAAPGWAGALYYVPAWKARRIDLSDAARRVLVEDPTVTRVDLLSDTYEVEQTINRD